MKKESSGFLSMAIGLAIIFLAVAVWQYASFNEPYSGMFGTAQTASTIHNNQPQNNQPISVSNWDTYQSSQSSFSFSYPSNFSLTQGMDNSLSLNVPVKNYFRTVLVKDGDIKLTVAAPTKNCPSPQVIGADATSSALIGSSAGSFKKVSGSDVGAGQLYNESLYTLSANGLCYSFDLVIHSTNGAGFYYSDPAQIASTDAEQAADKAAFMKLIDRMVSTFSLTK